MRQEWRTHRSETLRFLPTATRSGSRELCTSSFRCRLNCWAASRQPRDNRIQLHITKLTVLKIPLKGLLGGLHISVSDLFDPKGIPGIEVSGNEVFLDTLKLLPPPHIHGQLTTVRVVTPDIEEVYGNAEEAVTRVEQWRNFLRLNNGTIDFGKLTMHHVDLIMIDLSNDAWFDLDLNNYQNQLVNGYTRMTPEAGLQIFMPDLDDLPKSTMQARTSAWSGSSIATFRPRQMSLQNNSPESSRSIGLSRRPTSAITLRFGSACAELLKICEPSGSTSQVRRVAKTLLITSKTGWQLPGAASGVEPISKRPIVTTAMVAHGSLRCPPSPG